MPLPRATREIKFLKTLETSELGWWFKSLRHLRFPRWNARRIVHLPCYGGRSRRTLRCDIPSLDWKKLRGSDSLLFSLLGCSVSRVRTWLISSLPRAFVESLRPYVGPALHTRVYLTFPDRCRTNRKRCQAAVLCCFKRTWSKLYGQKQHRQHC
ncbi:hypothetical protein FA15DRAFT_239367 [Coprinopsis marcescibilis]|uniref:Uncharacterized protein n=1 Tax=Coprinopsis marcescibilis TaxID=230819 RepID=A0A5C3L275_COPMA|nr:hypothetical protein FA15DRAFT_239367 [Coprinopsis marcescibilis]